MKRTIKPALGCLLLLLQTGIAINLHLAAEEIPLELKTETRTLKSEFQRTETEIMILLPAQLKPAQKYPVLFLLPVEAGTGKKWGSSLQAAIDAKLVDRFKVICVMPTFADLPWYADHPTDPRLKQESYFIKEVMPLVEQHYPVSNRSEDRYLVGFSKSGWGAWSLLLRHPDLFHKAMAWDAPLMLDHPGPYGTQPIFGTEENFRKYQLTEQLQEQAATLQQEVRLYHWGYDAFRKQHAEMNTILNDLEIKSVYRDGPQREHHWESGWLGDAVELLLKED
ncbi:MAG: alpha/beta hydrolase-fold protein [Planctomycetaceae bacterium]